MKIKNKNKIYLIIITVLFLTFLQTGITFASPITESKLIELTNQDRQTNGLAPLNFNADLYLAAQNKAHDMIKNNYFEHYSPDGKKPWDFIHAVGYSYTKAGENLAMDFATSEGVERAWLASPTHRANILDSNYDDIAIAVIKTSIDNHNTTLIVEMFGKPTTNNQYPTQQLVNNIKNYILGFKTNNLSPKIVF